MPKAALPSNTIKGRIAESIVATLHENDESTQVECNVQLPAKNGTGRTREIDVLLTGHVGGYALRVAIECKNYNKRVGVPKIDEFVGKLRDVGLPKENAIFVSAVGFTKDALEVAAEHGIRTLLLEGLSDDRLASKIFNAVGSTLYILPRLAKVNIKGTQALDLDLTEHKELDPEAFVPAIFHVESKRSVFIADIAASAWNQGAVNPQLGEVELALTIQKDNERWANLFEGYTWYIETLTLTFDIKALAYTISGRGERFALRDFVDKSVVKHQQQAHFPDHAGQKLTPLQTQADLEVYQAQYDAIVGDDWHFTRVFHLPRVKSGDFYFPLSQRVLSQMNAVPDRQLTDDEWKQLTKTTIEQVCRED